MLELTCIALVGRSSGMDDGRECSCGARVSSELFNAGLQPLCRQHRELVEQELQRLHLGLGRVVIPSPEELAEWAEPWRRCVALVAIGDDLTADLRGCGHWACWTETSVLRSPLPVPLCVGHAVGLTYALRREWNRDFVGAIGPAGTSHPGWGWQLARAYGLPSPAWEPY